MRPPAQLTTARASHWREDFQAFYDQDPNYAPEFLRCWRNGTKRSRLQSIKDFAAPVEKHWDDILTWHTNHLTNGLLEGINSIIQAAKAHTRDYRNKSKIITIICLATAKLTLPTLTNPTPAYMPCPDPTSL